MRRKVGYRLLQAPPRKVILDATLDGGKSTPGARRDDVLGPIFDSAVADWPEHLEKLPAFWSSVMLTSGRYKGQPMAAHFRHEQAMTSENFGCWLALWEQATGEVLRPQAAAACEESGTPP